MYRVKRVKSDGSDGVERAGPPTSTRVLAGAVGLLTAVLVAVVFIRFSPYLPPAPGAPDYGYRTSTPTSVPFGEDDSAQGSARGGALISQGVPSPTPTSCLQQAGLQGSLPDGRGWQVTLQDVESISELRYSSIGTPERPTGKYVLLYLRLTNVSDHTLTIDPYYYALFDDRDARYTVCQSMACTLWPEYASEGRYRSWGYLQVAPRSDIDTIAIYDVAADADLMYYFVSNCHYFSFYAPPVP